MLNKSDLKKAQRRAAKMIMEAGIKIYQNEIKKIEVADFGLDNLESEGAQIYTFVSTDRIGAKVIVLFPNQTLPEHWHPPVRDDPGKEEVIRVITGIIRAYIPGENTLSAGFIPTGKENYYTVRHEMILKPGDQVLLEPGKLHWFQAGEEGAVVYSFSTTVRDIHDGFTDPEIRRITQVKEDD